MWVNGRLAYVAMMSPVSLLGKDKKCAIPLTLTRTYGTLIPSNDVFANEIPTYLFMTNVYLAGHSG